MMDQAEVDSHYEAWRSNIVETECLEVDPHYEAWRSSLANLASTDIATGEELCQHADQTALTFG